MGEYRTVTVSLKRDGWTSAHTTAGHSVFECAAIALHWFEVELPPDTRFRPEDHEVLEVSLVGRESYRVRVGRVREWMRSLPHRSPVS